MLYVLKKSHDDFLTREFRRFPAGTQCGVSFIWHHQCFMINHDDISPIYSSTDKKMRSLIIYWQWLPWELLWELFRFASWGNVIDFLHNHFCQQFVMRGSHAVCGKLRSTKWSSTKYHVVSTYSPHDRALHWLHNFNLCCVYMMTLCDSHPWKKRHYHLEMKSVPQNNHDLIIFLSRQNLQQPRLELSVKKNYQTKWPYNKNKKLHTHTFAHMSTCCDISQV